MCATCLWHRFATAVLGANIETDKRPAIQRYDNFPIATPCQYRTRGIHVQHLNCFAPRHLYFEILLWIINVPCERFGGSKNFNRSSWYHTFITVCFLSRILLLNVRLVQFGLSECSPELGVLRVPNWCATTHGLCQSSEWPFIIYVTWISFQNILLVSNK